MNPLKLFDSKVGEDPQSRGRNYNEFGAIGVTSRKKAELDAYNLNGVAQVRNT